jgi:hypothetical protein
VIPVPDRIFAVCSGPLGSVRAANRPTYWTEHGYPQDYHPREFVPADLPDDLCRAVIDAVLAAECGPDRFDIEQASENIRAALTSRAKGERS